MKSMQKKLCLLLMMVLTVTLLTGCGGPVAMNKAKVDDYILFGHYEQDNNLDNGKEAIEWLVLDKVDDNTGTYLLLISKYALDCKPFNETRKNGTYGFCSLRRWLNNEFLNAAFTSEEQEIIPVADVYTYDNPDYRTEAGYFTYNQVFLLDLRDVDEYFYPSKKSVCSPTEYAKSQGVYVNDYNHCCWWLSTPGFENEYAAVVLWEGGGHATGSAVDNDENGVRPAIWVKVPEQP